MPLMSRGQPGAFLLVVLLYGTLGLVGRLGAQQTATTQPAAQPAPAAGEGTADLAKATQNPVSSLISVPIQNNDNFGVGPFNRIQNVLNIQPVVPVKLNDKVTMVIRWITPIIYQPAPGTANLEVYGIEENTPAYFAATAVQNAAGVSGFGDMNPTFFFTPVKPHKLILAAGPTFMLPTATSVVLGQGKFSIGPSVVALTQPGPWTIGALVNNVWSVGGPRGRTAVNQMMLQYFINYNLKKGWYLSMSPILNANWKASPGNVWTVPVGGGAGRIVRLGPQPFNISAAFYGNAVHPTAGSSWSMRLQVALLFPKLTREQEIGMMQQRLKQLEQPQPQKK
jgi:hypothetical protein